MPLNDCVPTNKFDVEAMVRAKQIGFPALTPVLPELLEWMRDMNWPVAREVSDLLAEAGPEITPHIQRLLSSGDGAWKYWVLTDIVPRLSPDIRIALRLDLRRLAEHPTDDDREEEVDLLAKGILSSI